MNATFSPYWSQSGEELLRAWEARLRPEGRRRDRRRPPGPRAADGPHRSGAGAGRRRAQLRQPGEGAGGQLRHLRHARTSARPSTRPSCRRSARSSSRAASSPRSSSCSPRPPRAGTSRCTSATPGSSRPSSSATSPATSATPTTTTSACSPRTSTPASPTTGRHRIVASDVAAGRRRQRRRHAHRHRAEPVAAVTPPWTTTAGGPGAGPALRLLHALGRQRDRGLPAQGRGGPGPGDDPRRAVQADRPVRARPAVLLPQGAARARRPGGPHGQVPRARTPPPSTATR